MITKDEWTLFTKHVLRKMTEHVSKFITPIGKELEDNSDSSKHLKLLGTGTYVKSGNCTYLITNEHVCNHLATNSLTHQYYGNSNTLLITNHPVVEELPVDIACVAIDDEAWKLSRGATQAVDLCRFAKKHDPYDKELQFTIGYSGQRSRFLFGCICSGATPYLTQETELMLDEDYISKQHHFALPYRPDKSWNTEGSNRNQPLPPGLSGSLVWNTHAWECYNDKKDWSPSRAEVTGIIWGWPSSNACLLATRVEYLGIGGKIELIVKRGYHK